MRRDSALVVTLVVAPSRRCPPAAARRQARAARCGGLRGVPAADRLGGAPKGRAADVAHRAQLQAQHVGAGNGGQGRGGRLQGQRRHANCRGRLAAGQGGEWTPVVIRSPWVPLPPFAPRMAMSHADFPFNVLGSVLARNKTVVRRPFANDERLLYT